MNVHKDNLFCQAVRFYGVLMATSQEWSDHLPPAGNNKLNVKTRTLLNQIDDMKKTLTLLILLIASFPSLSQLRSATTPAVKVMFLQDSLTRKKISMPTTLNPVTEGKLWLEADPNDPRGQIFDTQLLIDVIHARGTSAVQTLSFTGIEEFDKNDVLKTLRPTLMSGDRIVITYHMMSEAGPKAYIINVR